MSYYILTVNEVEAQTGIDFFCSLSWDKKINFCSFAKGKEPLPSLDYEKLVLALDKVRFVSCVHDIE